MPAVASDYLTIPVRFDPDSGQSGDITLANIVAAFTAAGIPHSVEINNGFRHPKTNELLHANLKVHKDYIDQANAILATMFGVFQKGPPLPEPLWGVVITDLVATASISGGPGSLTGGNSYGVGLFACTDRFATFTGLCAAQQNATVSVPLVNATPEISEISGQNPGYPYLGARLFVNGIGGPLDHKAYISFTMDFKLDGKSISIQSPKVPYVFGNEYWDGLDSRWYLDSKLNWYLARGDELNGLHMCTPESDPAYYGFTAWADDVVASDFDWFRRFHQPGLVRSYEEAVAAGKWVDEV